MSTEMGLLLSASVLQVLDEFSKQVDRIDWPTGSPDTIQYTGLDSQLSRYQVRRKGCEAEKPTALMVVTLGDVKADVILKITGIRIRPELLSRLLLCSMCLSSLWFLTSESISSLLGFEPCFQAATPVLTFLFLLFSRTPEKLTP